MGVIDCSMALSNAGIPWGMMFLMPICCLFSMFAKLFWRRGFSWCGGEAGHPMLDAGLAKELRDLRQEVVELRNEIRNKE